LRQSEMIAFMESLVYPTDTVVTWAKANPAGKMDVSVFKPEPYPAPMMALHPAKGHPQTPESGSITDQQECLGFTRQDRPGSRDEMICTWQMRAYGSAIGR
jgi:hypothetical protein